MSPRRIEQLLSRVEPLVEREGRLGIFRLRILSRWAGPLYDFLGVRLLFLGRGATATREPDLRPLGGGFWVRASGGRRLRFVSEAIFLPGDAEVLEHVSSLSFDPQVPAFAGKAAGIGPGESRDWAAQAEDLRILVDEPMEVLVELRAPVRGHLVLADTDFPGWRVFVDGKAAVSLRANHAFRAVAIDAGHHRIRWIYHPDSFVVGVFLSSLFFCVMIGLSVSRWAVPSGLEGRIHSASGT